MKKSQLTWIKEQLLKHGEISRNTCLRNYISRLSARILDLEKDGWVFTTEKRGGDFVYKAAFIPEDERFNFAVDQLQPNPEVYKKGLIGKFDELSTKPLFA
jgi:hypothetical protein